MTRSRLVLAAAALGAAFALAAPTASHAHPGHPPRVRVGWFPPPPPFFFFPPPVVVHRHGPDCGHRYERYDRDHDRYERPRYRDFDRHERYEHQRRW
jgi:hypothetical protein